MSCRSRLRVPTVFLYVVATDLSIAFGKPHYGSVAAEASPAGNAFAAAHLALIFTVFTGFAVFAWVLYRRSKAPNKEREFIEDLHEEEQNQEEIKRIDRKRFGVGSAEKEERREPWEKSGDWWKT